jgi:hypothetical protein
MKMRRATIIGLALVSAGTAACGGGTTASRTTTTVTVVATASSTSASGSAAATMTDSPAVSTSPDDGTGATGTAGADGADSTPSAPILTGIRSAAKKLALVDVFEHDNWDEGSVSVPKQSGMITGVSTRLGCGNIGRLEWRFADQTGYLSIDVAQALDSVSSSTTLEFKLLSDQHLVATAQVPFNARGHLQASLSGVNAVILEVSVAKGSPSCAATAVITNMSVVPGAA